MAFGGEELRVIRRALALALEPGRASDEDVQDCLRLAESLDEATREAARLRAFLVADLARYRAALPGTAGGYLTLLEEVLAAGYRPVADDLAALRALRGNPAAAALLDRCQTLAERDVRTRLARRTALRTGRPDLPAVPVSRVRLTALPGGLADDGGQLAEPGRKPAEKQPADKPARPPAKRPEQPAPQPARRPIPTPGEVFPRRKPPQPPSGPPQQLAAG
ncbi:hypothetical protein AB0O01_19910 [Streptomyces sp. NPDC093252]|uniref:hypothetical protein n=1 Tax=Streptomyces sp. NPDC093252 TaxID=3154980 RepID=UPI0034490756